MFNELKKHTTKPKLYAPSTNKFWRLVKLQRYHQVLIVINLY
jgi:hypothetical protein